MSGRVHGMQMPGNWLVHWGATAPGVRCALLRSPSCFPGFPAPTLTLTLPCRPPTGGTPRRRRTTPPLPSSWPRAATSTSTTPLAPRTAPTPPPQVSARLGLEQGWAGAAELTVPCLLPQPPAHQPLALPPTPPAGVAAYLSPKVSGFLMKKELDYLGEQAGTGWWWGWWGWWCVCVCVLTCARSVLPG